MKNLEAALVKKFLTINENELNRFEWSINHDLLSHDWPYSPV